MKLPLHEIGKPLLLRTDQVAAHFSLSQSYVRKLRKSGLLPFFQLPTCCIRYPVSEWELIIPRLRAIKDVISKGEDFQSSALGLLAEVRPELRSEQCEFISRAGLCRRYSISERQLGVYREEGILPECEKRKGRDLYFEVSRCDAALRKYRVAGHPFTETFIALSANQGNQQEGSNLIRTVHRFSTPQEQQ